MVPVRIKICGITRIDDAIAALQAGADFIGLNLYAGPRKLTVQQASAILAATDAARMAVVLVDLSSAVGYTAASELATRHGVRIFQLYGDLKNVKCLPMADAQYWPVLRIVRRDDLRAVGAWVKSLPISTHAVLLDAFAPQGYGGTGARIHASWLAEARNAGEFSQLPPMILAGGLNPANIAQAVASVQPWAVDVSSGVENAGQPGIKSPAKIHAFIAAAHDIGGV